MILIIWGMFMGNVMNQYDTIIIGAGFAGVTVARELSQKGKKVLILEARDRIGGRTWYDQKMGRNLEIGGTWVHWFQPHVWAEITRYQLDIVPSPTCEKAYWIADHKLFTGTPEELFGRLDESNVKLLQCAREYFPLPYKPLTSDRLHEIDHLTLEDKIKELGLNKEDYDLLKSMWALNFNGPTEQAGFTQALRWVALSDYNWQLMMDICASFKLAKGTKALIEFILNDAVAELLLSKAVTSVIKCTEGYKVCTKDENEYYGKTVINTLPVNILNSIEFSPPLSHEKQQVGIEGQTSKGVKFWAKVKGIVDPFLAFAPADYPLNYAQVEYVLDGNSLIVGFGPDSKKLNPQNRNQVETALRKWIPDLEVIESYGHDWVADELSGETWPMQKNNQLTKYLAECQRPEEGIFLAGADYANGWAGFIDGAIESALSVSKKVEKYLNTTNVVEVYSSQM